MTETPTEYKTDAPPEPQPEPEARQTSPTPEHSMQHAIAKLIQQYGIAAILVEINKAVAETENSPLKALEIRITLGHILGAAIALAGTLENSEGGL